ncbi:MAG: DUF1592 domain-containing protein [Pirellulaceae bacterium]
MLSCDNVFQLILRRGRSRPNKFYQRAMGLVFLTALYCAVGGIPVVSSADDLQDALQTDLQPLLKTYCLDCHNSDSAEGDVVLNVPGAIDAFRRDRELWMRALRQVRSGVMPPSDAMELPDAQRERMSQLIDRIANSIDCGPNVNPGQITLRRLNSSEYRNTIRELTGIDYVPAKGFPGDDVGYGFDNIGDVLSLPPLLMEKYLEAAEEIMGQAIKTPDPIQIFQLARDGASLVNAERYGVSEGRLLLYSHGEVHLEESIPFDAKYELTIKAYGDQAGDEPAKIEVKLDDKQLKILDVPATETTDYTFPVELKKGTHKLSFTFINDFYREAKGDQKGADRNLYIARVELAGKSQDVAAKVEGPLPESHRKLIFATPGPKVSAEDASVKVIQRFASRAFRRPATRQEVDKLSRLAAAVRDDGGSFDESMQVAFQAVLVSPHFIYKVEQPRKPNDAGVYPSVDDYEFASRLSYFLWNSMPDDELFALAYNGTLRRPQVLREQVARLIKDSRSTWMIDSFASQWLQLRNLDKAAPDEKQFPEFNDELKQLLRRETLTFFAAIVRYDRPITEFLDGRFTYVNEPLAKYYGIKGIMGDEFQFVRFDEGMRGGLLTQASILTVTSNPTRTSPVKRGKWILENILGTPPPPAPANVPELERAELTGTMRERLVQHRENPACASCHQLMDPLGFALENFDAIGRWRQQADGQPVDARGELPGGVTINGVGDLRNVLSTQRRDLFVRCLTEKLLTYALGRGLEYYDKCVIDKIVARLESSEFRSLELLLAIVESDPFQKQGVRE